ncbi:ATP-dependent nuclease [Novosphingobium sp. Chol11]|uniref:ATP-dependent nuclease n=1 Tax=Novosphingobium sp. Chol11 TaxID=1385763 RepID=UPI000BE37F2B|nr:AAA family ATPase [Novosphingobium sp. Chol11]
MSLRPSDFFIQSTGEVGPGGVTISYGIRHDRWRNSEPHEGTQTRQKKHGGKWTNYDKRVSRNVVYHGVQRVVPYYERSTHKSYRSLFKPTNLDAQIRNRIAQLASRIVGKKYADFESLEHSRYSIPKVKSGELSYSGFNMGAGESAVLEILSTIFAAGPGSLLVIDEIELGLHERAQSVLINVLKDLCLELKCQIICTTHAYEILAALPPEGRIYVEPIGGHTQILPGISAEYACGRMGRSDPHELDIFVEDEVALATIQASLGHDLRNRSRLMEIGSHSSLKRLMAARYMEKRRNCLCLLDGDQRGSLTAIKSEIANMCDGKFTTEREKIYGWISERVAFLMGDEWPEKWLFERAIEMCGVSPRWEQSPADRWGLGNESALCDILEQSLGAGKHNEFPHLANALSLPEENVRRELILALRTTIPTEFDLIAALVEKALQA